MRASFFRNIARNILLFASYPEVLYRLSVLLLLLAKERVTERAFEHLVIPPPGRGNIGDTALLEAFIDNVTGRVAVIVQSRSDYDLSRDYHGRVEALVARGFVYGNIVSHLLAVYRIRRQFLATQSLSILGADVMDGNYNNRASCNRANVASLARRFDIPVGIIGFSWNAAPKAQARAALQRASRLGAQLYLRDPVSAARARRDGLCNVVETSDIVFLGKRISNNAYNRARGLRKARLRYVVVNISALLFAGESDIHGFVEIVRRILLLNIDVVILPHVSRPGADDKEICRAVARFFHKGNVALIDELLRPSDVCGLVKNAEFVIAGRMHLAIMALSFAVPAIVTNSQGKVEGLVKLFHIEELCLQPGRDHFRRMSELINSIADHRQDFAERIERRLPEVIEMANRNFQWLPVR